MTDYTPITCGVYERYELAILRRRQLRLCWREDNVIYDQTVTPVGLETRAGEEFLVFLDADGSRRRVRLDRIRKTETV